jgi:hypothetical protein
MGVIDIKCVKKINVLGVHWSFPKIGKMKNNTHLHFVNMSITLNILMQINILFYLVCSNVIVWPNATLCAIY